MFLGSSALFPYERIIFVFRIFLIEPSKLICILSINQRNKRSQVPAALPDFSIHLFIVHGL